MKYIINPYNNEMKNMRERAADDAEYAEKHSDTDMTGETFCDIVHGGNPTRMNIRSHSHIQTGDILDFKDARYTVRQVETIHPSLGNYGDKPVPNVHHVIV